MNARLLVTGHSGFLGKALVAQLEGQGMAWEGISSRDGQSLTESGALERLPPAATIIHLAGRIGVPQSWNAPYETHRANFLMTLAVMEHARRCGARVILMSSYVYGPPKVLPVDEHHPLAATNPYGWSKLESEMVAQAYAQDFAVPVTALRLFGVYGPGQDDDQLIPAICRQALTSDIISLADPRPKRDLLWVEDVAKAIIAVHDAPAKPGFLPYNLGSGTSHSVADIVAATLARTGPRQVVWRNEFRPNEVLDCVADCRRFNQDFGWSPKVGLDEGLKNMLMAMERKLCS